MSTRDQIKLKGEITVNVWFVETKRGWHVRLITDDGKVSDSDQAYETQALCEAAFEKFVAQIGATRVRAQ